MTLPLIEALSELRIHRAREILEKHHATIDIDKVFQELGHSIRISPAVLSLLVKYGADIDKPRYIVGDDRSSGELFKVGFREFIEAFTQCRDVELIQFLATTAPLKQVVDWRQPVTNGKITWQALVDISAVACRVRMFSDPPHDPYDVERVMSNAQFLRDRWKIGQWKPSPYDEAIMSILYVLQRGEQLRNERSHVAFSTPSDPEIRIAIEAEHEAVIELNFLAEDCRHSKEAAGRVIDLEIQTHGYKSQTIEKGWQVLWKRMIFERDERVPFEPFRTISSPATTTLAPGRYLLLLRKGAKTIGPFAASFGGGRERDEGKLQLPVPE